MGVSLRTSLIVWGALLLLLPGHAGAQAVAPGIAGPLVREALVGVEPVGSWTESPLALSTSDIAPLQAAEGGGWKRGMLWGGVIGAGLGIAAFVFVDAIPCDSCSGTGADSSADGSFPEFVLGFGITGALLGALIGAL